MDETLITLKNFTDCSEEELEMILSWRNSDSVAKNSINSGNIKKDEHYSFVEKLKDDKTKLYFLVSYAKGYLGVISFIGIGSADVEVGYYKNIGCKEKGIGVLLLNAAAKFAKEQLSLQHILTMVKVGNEASKISMERAGFERFETKDKTIKNRNEEIKLEAFKRILI